MLALVLLRPCPLFGARCDRAAPSARESLYASKGCVDVVLMAHLSRLPQVQDVQGSLCRILPPRCARLCPVPLRSVGRAPASLGVCDYQLQLVPCRVCCVIGYPTHRLPAVDVCNFIVFLTTSWRALLYTPVAPLSW